MKKRLVLSLVASYCSVGSWVCLGETALPSSALAQSGGHTKLPEFFGVYARVTGGELVDLQPVTPHYFKSMEKAPTAGRSHQARMRDNDMTRYLRASSAPAKAYLRGVPAAKIRPSELEGFYVYGNFNVEQFFLTQFVSSSEVLTSTTIVMEDGGPGVKSYQSYVDGQHGWSLQESFRYMEVKPKVYWIALRKDTNITRSSKYPAAAFVGIKFGRGKCYPFGFAKEKYAELLDLASALLGKAAYKQCIDRAQESLEHRATPTAYVLISGSYAAQSRYDDAVRAAEEGLQKWPRDSDLSRAAGRALYEQGDYAAAIPRLAVALDHTTLALCDGELGVDLDGAIEAGKKAASRERAPKAKKKLYCMMARCYLDQGNWKKGRSYCKKALKIDPGYPAALQEQRRAEFKKMEADQANPTKGFLFVRWRKKPQPPRTSRQEFGPRLSGTWNGILAEGLTIQLIVEASGQDDSLKGTCKVGSEGSSKSLTLGMRGRMNPRSGQAILSRAKRLRKQSWLREFSHIFASLPPDGANVDWQAPGWQSLRLERD